MTLGELQRLIDAYIESHPGAEHQPVVTGPPDRDDRHRVLSQPIGTVRGVGVPVAYIYTLEV
ncbi:hypothetical protein CDO52_00930 [Nocardiopsis gilva YIM 90087]|uniref:Uncharacterized protein n=1 Tax=Nocardiopsis gilva YIM 90087 TaxID=1235441 RepID=A0A223S079_9ACTN|nr:hypothetical protein [Nocardiopsis gilva]ASU81543.1 hypothetical protein CDO52_00930 [Nocardiopsis gilva YIM 90087]